MILDPGFDLTLRPMKYPVFFEMYRDAIKNTWTVEEVDFSTDTVDLQKRLDPAERHLVNRLVAFFATGDSIVSNNLVLSLYKHINAPEARMYLSRQLYEEALHVQFYLTLLDTYIPDIKEREAAFAAIQNIPSIQRKAEFCFKWIDSIGHAGGLRDPRGQAAVPAEPHLLRLLHRRPVLLRRLRLRVLPADRRVCSTASPRAPTGCSATRAATWRSPSRWSTRSARRTRRSSTRISRPRSSRC